MQKENLSTVGSFWDSLNYDEVHSHILNFENTNKKNLSNQEMHELLMKTIMFNNKFGFPTVAKAFPEGKHFYRARQVFQSDIPSAQKDVSGWKIKDLWEPPTSIINKMGRLNYKNESMLYLANAFSLCLLESRIKENEFFVISKFRNRNNLSLAPIGFPYDFSKFNLPSEHSKLIGNEFMDFFRREFSRDVGVGTEWLYKSSNIIAKDLFDWPEPISHGWLYPSMQDHNGLNICLRPELGHEDLVLEESLLIHIIRVDNDKTNFNVVGAKTQNSNHFVFETKK